MDAHSTQGETPRLPPIHTIRGVGVVLDSDLSALYGVPTMVFNQAVKRNAKRFPTDFLFQLSDEEFATLKTKIESPRTESSGCLRSQTVILKPGRGRHRKYPPWAFTEHGAIMAATILRSPLAIEMSVYVVRSFVRLREQLMTNAVIHKRLAQMDKKLLEHDVVLQDLVGKLLPLLSIPPETKQPKRRIGFQA